LRESVFENVKVMIPFAYTELLEEEYGAKSLTRTKFEGHRFDSQQMEWIPDPTVPRSRQGQQRIRPSRPHDRTAVPVKRPQVP